MGHLEITLVSDKYLTFITDIFIYLLQPMSTASLSQETARDLSNSLIVPPCIPQEEHVKLGVKMYSMLHQATPTQSRKLIHVSCVRRAIGGGNPTPPRVIS